MEHFYRSFRFGLGLTFNQQVVVPFQNLDLHINRVTFLWLVLLQSLL